MNANKLTRAAVYAVLLIAAFFFLAPLYVMLVTSFKDAEQIRSGNLLSLPHGLNFESWQLAWSTACTGAVSYTHLDVYKRQLLPRLRAAVQGKLPPLTRGVELVSAGLGERAGDFGALALVASSF